MKKIGTHCIGALWKGAENLAPSGFDPHTVQPIDSRYTVYAIPADTDCIIKIR
jgi:hypothetical protein